MEINKIWANQILKFVMTILRIIHIYLDDGNHIRIVRSCSNAEKHTMSHILHKNNLATGRPDAKNLIKYNSNGSEETMKKRRIQ